MSDHHEDHHRRSSSGVVPLVVVLVIVLVVFMATPWGEPIRDAINGQPSGVVPTPAVVTTAQPSGDSDGCLKSGGVWRQDGDSPGYCMWLGN